MDQSAKEDIGILTRSDKMVDVVDREFHKLIGGAVVRLRQRATEAIRVARRQADHRDIVRRLMDGVVETRARIPDEDEVLLVRSRELNGFCETRIRPPASAPNRTARAIRYVKRSAPCAAVEIRASPLGFVDGETGESVQPVRRKTVPIRATTGEQVMDRIELH